MFEGLPGRSTETRYARVPLWLFQSGVSLQAIATYAWLHGRYGHLEEKFPSYRTLARELEVSKGSVINYVKELRDAGALVVEARYRAGGQTSNEYVIAFNEPIAPEGSGQHSDQGVVNMLTGSDQGEPDGGGQHTDQGGQRADQGGQHTDQGGQPVGRRRVDLPIADVPIQTKTFPPALPGMSNDPGALDRAPKPPAPGSDDDPHWAAFWAAYPRKKGKGDARKAWAQAIKNGADPAEIIAGAQRYAQERAAADPKYTKYPASWLRAERWTDEEDPAYQPKNTPQQDNDDPWAAFAARVGAN